MNVLLILIAILLMMTVDMGWLIGGGRAPCGDAAPPFEPLPIDCPSGSGVTGPGQRDVCVTSIPEDIRTSVAGLLLLAAAALQLRLNRKEKAR